MSAAPRNECFVAPLCFGDEWRLGKSVGIAVAELKWLYGYYPEVGGGFPVREEPASRVLAQERRRTGEGGRGAEIRSLLAAFAIREDPAAAEYIRSVGRLRAGSAARCLDGLLPAISDRRVKEFIASCIDMDSLNDVAETCSNVNRAVLDRRASVLGELAGLGMVPRLGSFGTMTAKHTDFSFMWTSELRSPLSQAVVRNDLDEARYLISHGADVDQMMFNSGGRGKDDWRLYSTPILTMVRSVPMYRLFAGAGVELRRSCCFARHSMARRRR